MKTNTIQSCHLGPEISPEQVIGEHYFLCLASGWMMAYNGDKTYRIEPGDYCIARKNHLMRYRKHQQDSDFQKIIIVLDELFLQRFLKKHPTTVEAAEHNDPVLFVKGDSMLDSFISSLEPYYTGEAQIDETFADIKREELLLILLRNDPGLANVFFNFGAPQKIDLKEFMNRNFRFNISIDRFAYLTGRSVSAFKRDFKHVFNDTPGCWLTKKRLKEAYFLIQNQSSRSSDIYLDLGFEDLSHFSFAFKKQFGLSPNELLNQAVF